MTATFDRFIERVHQLLQAGYASLTEQEIEHYHRCNEPDITGGLALRIQQLVDGGQVSGITRAWCVVDNWPEAATHLPLKKQPRAKTRKLPDLKFRFGGQREALYFRFEAKKLAGTGDYADLISHQDEAGGLLGYVQTESPEIHAERVRTALANDPRKYRVKQSGSWSTAPWKNGPQCSFRALHSREGASVILIYYSFLHFRAAH